MPRKRSVRASLMTLLAETGDVDFINEARNSIKAIKELLSKANLAKATETTIRLLISDYLAEEGYGKRIVLQAEPPTNEVVYSRRIGKDKRYRLQMTLAEAWVTLHLVRTEKENK